MKALRWFVWAFFLNDEDPDPRPDLWPGKPRWWRAFRWWLRNPAHNFTHHVIGWHGKVYRSVTIWTSRWFQRRDRITIDGRRLPCWYFEGRRTEGYFGWRSSGAFGVSFRKQHK